MIKQIIIIICLSILITLGISEFAWLLNLLWKYYSFIKSNLSLIFNDGPVGSMVNRNISLLLVSISLTAIVALPLKLIFKQKFSRIMDVLFVFFILTASTVALHINIATK